MKVIKKYRPLGCLKLKIDPKTFDVDALFVTICDSWNFMFAKIFNENV